MKKSTCKRGHDTQTADARYPKGNCKACTIERASIRQLAWAKANPEEHSARVRQWRANNPDKVRTIEKNGYARNASKRREKSSRWAKANPHKVVEYRNRRRARVASSIGFVPDNHVELLLHMQSGICFYCFTELANYHIEHKTPLSRGGTHDFDNLCLSCVPCNLAKHTKTADEFLRVA